MARESIKFTHNEQTIKKMSQAQFWAVNTSLKIATVCACFCTILAGGVGAMSSPVLMALLAMGILFLLAFLNQPDRNAQQVLRRLQGKFPTVTYTLEEESICADFGSNADTIPYRFIAKLLFDKEYYYILFYSALMYIVPIRVVQHPESFKNKLSEKSGIKWKSRQQWFSFGLKDITSHFRSERNNRMLFK